MTTPADDSTAGELARRLLLAQVPDDDGAPNMFEIERGLRQLESSAGQAALVLKKCRIEVAECKRALRQARAAAWAEAKMVRREDGKLATVQEREMYMDKATDDEQFALAVAEAALAYARDLVDERAGQRSSLQTRAKLTLEALALAGYAGTSAPRWRTDERTTQR